MLILLSSLIIKLILSIIFVVPAFYIAGKLVLGEYNVSFSDALWIVVLGEVAGFAVGLLFGGILEILITFFIWLFLIKELFDCTWLDAILVSIASMIILVLVIIALILLGILAVSFLI